MLTPAPRKRGLAHLLAATTYSWAGFCRLLKEQAFRHELLLAAGVLAVMALVGVGLANVTISAALFLMLFAVEALNTAIEEIVDRVSPEISQTGRHAKDLGSFAASCMVIASVGFSTYAVIVTVWS